MDVIGGPEQVELPSDVTATAATVGTFDGVHCGHQDVLARLDGVGDVRVFSARDYSMRIWLDPQRMGQLGLTAGDVLGALRSQNVQVASGVLNQEPVPDQAGFEEQLTGAAAGDGGDVDEVADPAGLLFGRRDQVRERRLGDV